MAHSCPGADLSLAQLQGANLWGAQLRARIWGKPSCRVRIWRSPGSRARIWWPSCRARTCREPSQGANLREAQLQGADLSLAWLDVTDLSLAQLQGANLREAQLEGAHLRGAQLQGADLRDAQLQGADLRYAGLYGALVEPSGTALLDLRAANWTPLDEERLAEIREVLHKTVANTEARKAALARIERAGRAGLAPPIFESCLIDAEVTPGLTCQRQWLPAEIAAFQSELFPVLEKRACQFSWIARDLIQQTYHPEETPAGRFGLAGRFEALLEKEECEGLSSLPEADKDLIRAFDEAEQRGELRAGKPAEEVPASPTPLPASEPAAP